VTGANVDTFMAHVVTKRNDFLKTLPKLVDDNLKTGKIANEASSS
jgi:ribose transport system substrate-binding protein